MPVHGDSPTNALHESFSIQEVASSEGFDWPDIAGVIAKVREEIDEVERAHRDHDTEHARSELGDLLFVCVNLARHLEADPSIALIQASQRFKDRYGILKTILHEQEKSLQQCSFDELNKTWEQAKILHQSQTNSGLT